MSSDEDILMEKTQKFAKNNKKLENLILKYFLAPLLGNHNRQGKKKSNKSTFYTYLPNKANI